MTTIKTVAVLGATGNLGPALVQALHDANFTVTAITRANSSNPTPSTFPSDVTVKSVDYTSPEALRAAFTGQDAVVSAVATPALGIQIAAIDAAVAAGVKRFIPSEYGVDTRQAVGTTVGNILAKKIEVVEYLQEVVKKGTAPGFSWTGLSTGLFLDWGFDFNGLGVIDLKEKKATIIDSGNEKFYTSTLSHIGRSVAGILLHPDETANKYLATASHNFSQNELLAVVEELTGTKFAVIHEKSEDLTRVGLEKLAAGEPIAFIYFLRTWNGTDGIGHGLTEEESDNALVGVPYEDTKAEVQRWLERAGAGVSTVNKRESYE
ncbi:uncharacterized protein C8A04DRAFT_31087 [Dichotomopilus funicola]|uniref:NmrA-like domain-containing protein n=1 Tax=Dichotomopilus funicola TaxID=1934379 RepID=A0AAN6ZK25_9PEZI|nr:hypothetical protein C8A04DRAFT_31087 [Dichotomopilus funicola]